MIKFKRFFLLFILISGFLFSREDNEFNFFNEVIVTISNPAEIDRIDELVSVEIDKLKSVNPKFNKKAFIVYFDGNEIPSQIYNDGDKCSIVFVCNFKPKQSKEVSIKFLENSELRRDYKSRTYAELAMKFDAVYKDKKFNSDHFENYTKIIVPKIHTDHDALFKYEGPGWESEKVGYRFYLDWRNATDIFGKKVNELVLRDVGVNDVIAKDDSYHKMQEWGMDIFKVGNSLGIGSIGMINVDKIEMVSKTDEVRCEITSNGPILSEVKTNYDGWLVGDNKYDLTSRLSITAGSRVTNAHLSICKDAKNITTGLAKYENTKFLKSDAESKWQFIAIYGKQTLAEDNAGIVLFYDKTKLIEQGEDDLNYYVKLNPVNGSVDYSFAAAWEQEPNGLKNIDDFTHYINNQLIKLNNPLIIEIK